jgi:hypothetical protein
MHVPNQENNQSCICVRGIDSDATIFQIDFGIVPTVWYFYVFFFIIYAVSYHGKYIFLKLTDTYL